MTRALITGISGFVGSHLAEYLLANTDWHITGSFRWNEPQENLRDLMPEINASGRVRLVDADLTDAWSINRLMVESMPDYVFHLAAQSYVIASIHRPIETLTANALGTGNVLEAIRLNCPKAWVHVCSSSEVYGKVEPRTFILPSGSLPPVPLPGHMTYYDDDNPPRPLIDEDQLFSPASPYSISKVTTDLLGQYYAKAYGMNIQITRMFSHTGPRRGDVFMESSFAKQIAMIEAGQMEPPIKVGNLESVRTIADVRDAVRAYHMLLTVNPQRGAIYNIGGNHTCTARDVLIELLRHTEEGYPNEVDPARLRPIDADHQVPDCSKFKTHTGWEPEIPFEQTMIDLLNWWREKVKHGTPMQR